MNSLKDIIDQLEENGIRAVVFDMSQKQLSILNMGTPIHELRYDQVTDLYTTDSFDPNIVELLVDHGIVPRSSWDA
jgi:hypothetical protein